MKIHNEPEQAAESTEQAPEMPATPTQEQQALNNLIQMSHAFVDSQAAIILMALDK
jgi:hypothetical protein